MIFLPLPEHKKRFSTFGPADIKSPKKFAFSPYYFILIKLIEVKKTYYIIFGVIIIVIFFFYFSSH